MAPPFKPGPRPKPETDLDRAIRAQVEKDKVDIKINRVRKLARAGLQLQKFRNRIDDKAERWMICARNFGAAYSRAAKNHLDALAKVDKYSALSPQEMFSALTVLMSGGTSMIWNSASIQRASDLIKNTLKDVLMAAYGEALSAMGPVVAALPPARENTAADDALDELYGTPLECERMMADKVSGWKLTAFAKVDELINTIQRKPEEDWDLWDEETAQDTIDLWWEGDGKSPGADALWGMDPAKSEEDRKRMAYDLERAMWAKWMPRLRTAPGFHLPIVGIFDPSYGGKRWDYEDVKPSIEARFKKKEEGGLNIFVEAGMDGIHWYKSRRLEAETLISWAGRFRRDHPVWNK
jgi:hypothetical protein